MSAMTDGMVPSASAAVAIDTPDLDREAVVLTIAFGQSMISLPRQGFAHEEK